MTLRWRNASILAVVALCVGAFATIASYLSTASQLRSSIDDTLRSRATAVNGTSAGFGGHGGGPDGGHGPGGGRETSCPNPGDFAPATAAQLLSTNGTVMVCIDGAPRLPVDDQDRFLRQGSVRVRTVQVDGAPYRVLSTPWQAGGTLQIGRSLAESEALLGRLRLQLAVLVVVATVLAAGLGWAMATRLVRPIVRLRDVAHRIATTLDLSTPIDVTASGEVGSLTSSFTTMVADTAHWPAQQRRTSEADRTPPRR